GRNRAGRVFDRGAGRLLGREPARDPALAVDGGRDGCSGITPSFSTKNARKVPPGGNYSRGLVERKGAVGASPPWSRRRPRNLWGQWPTPVQKAPLELITLWSMKEPRSGGTMELTAEKANEVKLRLLAKHTAEAAPRTLTKQAFVGHLVDAIKELQ